MNFSTLIGFLLSIGVFITALTMSAKNYHIFLDTHAILIVMGGTMAASSVSFSVPRVLGLLRIFVRRMLGKNKRNYMALIDQIVMLSSANRKGRPAFEASLGKIRSLSSGTPPRCSSGSTPKSRKRKCEVSSRRAWKRTSRDT